MIVKQKLHI